MEKTTLNREAIIAEYLTGEKTFRQLEAKHGIDFRTIQYWVSSYKITATKLKTVYKYRKLLCLTTTTP